MMCSRRELGFYVYCGDNQRMYLPGITIASAVCSPKMSGSLAKIKGVPLLIAHLAIHQDWRQKLLLWPLRRLELLASLWQSVQGSNPIDWTLAPKKPGLRLLLIEITTLKGAAERRTKSGA